MISTWIPLLLPTSDIPLHGIHVDSSHFCCQVRQFHRLGLSLDFSMQLQTCCSIWWLLMNTECNNCVSEQLLHLVHGSQIIPLIFFKCLLQTRNTCYNKLWWNTVINVDIHLQMKTLLNVEFPEFCLNNITEDATKLFNWQASLETFSQIVTIHVHMLADAFRSFCS